MGRLMVGVSGVRGIAGKGLTAEVAKRFAQAFALMLPGDATIVLGRDTRPSGPLLRDAVVSGLKLAGLKVVDLGVVSTPGVALMIKRLSADGGVVITASHNPAPYNGIKFMTPQGLNLPADQAARLKKIWQGKGFVIASHRGSVRKDRRTHAIHVRAVCDIVDVPAIRGRKFKVVLDSINGVGGEPGAMLLERLGCQLVHLNAEPTGQFAHKPEPIAANLAGLCQAVRAHAADIGFAQDPDADRLVIADEKGRFIGEEYTLTLTSAFVLRRTTGPLATNLSTTRMMDDVANAFGVKLHRTPVGEANVAERMVKSGCVFGGEGNGGVMDPRVVIVRDSFVGMALMLNALAESGKTVSQLAADWPRYEMIKEKFPCPLRAAPQILQRVRCLLAGRPQAKVNDEDGLRVDLPQGWIHVRASNTEPIMRITTEATTPEIARALTHQVRAVADDILGQ